MAQPVSKFSCPKCGRMLLASGDLTINDGSGGNATVPTFQCDECLVPVEFLGEKTEVALTFAVAADGKPFDPASEDGRLHF